MCHLVTDDEDGCSIMKHVGLPSKEYNVNSLKKVHNLLFEKKKILCALLMLSYRRSYHFISFLAQRWHFQLE